MAGVNSDLETEIKSWLKVALKAENSSDFSITISGNSEKGDGYMGDIVFVTAKSTTKGEEYNLVLKCSKRSKALRETGGIKEIYLNEIFIYEKLLPYYMQFQREKGAKDIFESVPKCYGSYTSEDIEVLVLENLKCSGYELWPKKESLPREHIDLIATEYGKFHAISVALKEQQPTEFQRLVDSLSIVFTKNARPDLLFAKPIETAYELLKNDLDDEVLQKWIGFKHYVMHDIKHMLDNYNGLQVILHGDSWNNNFMFLHDKTKPKTPLKVAILDWQIARCSTPILDLSYFLFSCVSSEDFKHMDDILLIYYKSFVKHLGLLGVNKPEDLYSYDQFLKDWKSYSRFGVMMTSLLMKIVSTNKDEVTDVAEAAERGQHFSETFSKEINDKENYKKRIRPVVEYAVKHDLI